MDKKPRMDRRALVKILKAMPEAERAEVVADSNRETDEMKARMQDAAEALKTFIHGAPHDAV
jgi:hypothetical protein